MFLCRLALPDRGLKRVEAGMAQGLGITTTAGMVKSGAAGEGMESLPRYRPRRSFPRPCPKSPDSTLPAVSPPKFTAPAPCPLPTPLFHAGSISFRRRAGFSGFVSVAAQHGQARVSGEARVGMRAAAEPEPRAAAILDDPRVLAAGTEPDLGVRGHSGNARRTAPHERIASTAICRSAQPPRCE
jgi:hypothetical protein